MVVALWEGQVLSGGLSVSETEESRLAVMQEGARRPPGPKGGAIFRGRQETQLNRVRQGMKSC